MNKALLLIDIQNDFLPGGALAVKEGDRVVEVANRLMPQFDLVIATKDWHPADHGSFAAQHPGKKPGNLIDLHGINQILWPIHCVQHTTGADFAPGLNTKGIHKVIYKGMNVKVDSYSAFFDNGRRIKTELDEFLTTSGIRHLVIMGLATDYCVKFSVLDALDLGYQVTVIKAGVRAVNLHESDGDQALEEMSIRGAEIH